MKENGLVIGEIFNKNSENTMMQTTQILHNFFKSLLTIILLTVWLLAFWGCSSQKSMVREKQHKEALNSDKKPSWIYSGKHSTYSQPKYIVGIGMAKGSRNPVTDRQLADQNAFSEIAQQIIAHVSSDISIEQLEVSGDKVETILEKTIANTRVQTSLTLKGLKIVERYYDENENIYYSFGIFNRTAASASYRTDLLKYKANYHKYMQKADQYLKTGKINHSLLSLREALLTTFQYKEVKPWYKLLAIPDNFNESERYDLPSQVAVINSLTEKLSHIQLNITKGDKQKYIIDKSLPIPLTVRVSLADEKEIPINNFPVHFYFEKGKGEIISTVRTNAKGFASSIIKKIERSPSKIYMVSAELNFEEFTDTAAYATEWNKQLSTGRRKVIFKFERKKSSIPIKIPIIIKQPNQYTVQNSIAEQVFSQELSDVGLSPVYKSDIKGINIKMVHDAVQNAQIPTLNTIFSDTFDIIIVGEISAHPLSDVQGMKIFSANGFVKAFSLKKNITLGEKYLHDIRGFGISNKQAEKNAIQKATFKAAKTIVADILLNL